MSKSADSNGPEITETPDLTGYVYHSEIPPSEDGQKWPLSSGMTALIIVVILLFVLPGVWAAALAFTSFFGLMGFAALASAEENHRKAAERRAAQKAKAVRRSGR